jgi:hypothetical protein
MKGGGGFLGNFLETACQNLIFSDEVVKKWGFRQNLQLWIKRSFCLDALILKSSGVTRFGSRPQPFDNQRHGKNDIVFDR